MKADTVLFAHVDGRSYARQAGSWRDVSINAGANYLVRFESELHS
jgi:hypothetical protein